MCQHDGPKVTTASTAQPARPRTRPRRCLVRNSPSPRTFTTTTRLVHLRRVLPLCVPRRALLDTSSRPKIHTGQSQGKRPTEGLFRPNVSYLPTVHVSFVHYGTPADRRARDSSARPYYILLLILFIPFPFSDAVGSLQESHKTLDGLQGVASLHHEVRRHAPIQHTSL